MKFILPLLAGLILVGYVALIASFPEHQGNGVLLHWVTDPAPARD